MRNWWHAKTLSNPLKSVLETPKPMSVWCEKILFGAFAKITLNVKLRLLVLVALGKSKVGLKNLSNKIKKWSQF